MAVGAALLADVVPGFGNATDPGPTPWLGTGIVAVSGAGLVVGILTRVMAAGAGLSLLAAALGVGPHAGFPLAANCQSLLLTAAVALALTMLGPGALSADARLFGRREIVIPDAARRQTPD